MTIISEIESAIVAHSSWKNKLLKVIELGECDTTPAMIRGDNNCSFGKWLHLRLHKKFENDPYFDQVIELHAHFHREAAEVLTLALNGNKKHAKERLSDGGDLTFISNALVEKLYQWQAWLTKNNLDELDQ